MWSQYAELGLLGLPFPEEHGGFGGGGIEIMLVMEAFGRALALEPYLATVVLAGTALRLAGSEAQQTALMPQVAEGKLLWLSRMASAQARYDLPDVLTTAKPKGGGWVLDGAKSVVAHGDGADRLIVSARTSGERDDTAGIRPVPGRCERERRRPPLLPDARRHPGRRDRAERGRGRARRCARASSAAPSR